MPYLSSLEDYEEHLLGVLVFQALLEIFRGSMFSSASRQGALAFCIVWRLSFSSLYCLLWDMVLLEDFSIIHSLEDQV
jgi:hypothetical protein